MAIMILDVVVTAADASGASSVLTPANVQGVLDWAGSLTGIVSAITANPILSLVGIGGVAIIVGLVWWFFGAKINAYLVDLAQKKTEQNKTDFLKNKIPENAAAGQADNKTQSNLENKT